MQTPQLSMSLDPATAKSQTLPGSWPDRAQERSRQQQQAKHGSLPDDASSRGQSLMQAVPMGGSIDEQRRKALEAILKVCLPAYAHARIPNILLIWPWHRQVMPPQMQLQWRILTCPGIL